MDYKFGKAYFSSCKSRIKQYPYLNKDIETDILIVGGGVNGALLNYYLSKNHNCTLIERERIGQCCTSLATVLLEYQLDDFSKQLKSEMTKKEIVGVYQMGLDSIEKIKGLMKEIGNNCHFNLRPSFLYTNSLLGVKAVKDEFDFRKENGFKAEFFDSTSNPFPFDIKAGIYCSDGGAEFNAYLFTKQLIENSQNQQSIFENTTVKTIEKRQGGFVVETKTGERILAKKVILSTGFSFELMGNKELCKRYITYSIVTNKVGVSWQGKALVQDSENPYHYLRILPDGRLIFGGCDVEYKNQHVTEEKSRKMYDKLVKDLRKMLNDDSIEIEYEFCGFFAETKNNLGLIGEDGSGLIYFLSCGANGIINAFYGVEIVEDILKGEKNKFSHLFAPLREL